MVAKQLPPELAEQLTPENLKNLGEKAGGMIKWFQGSLVHIVKQNNTILAQQSLIMEAMGIDPTRATNGGNNTAEHGTGDSGSGDASGTAAAA